MLPALTLPAKEPGMGQEMDGRNVEGVWMNLGECVSENATSPPFNIVACAILPAPTMPEATQIEQETCSITSALTDTDAGTNLPAPI